MAKVLQHRRDTTANLASVSGSIGEFFMDTTKNTLVVMDGSTNGGHPLQTELTSGTSIKTINGTSLLGSGNITISGGGDFSAVAEDILPAFDGVYDLGSSTEQWYDLFVSNSVTIDGGSLTGNATGLVTDTMLIGDLLLTTNTITPDASTALQYNGDQGIVDILGNLDVSAGDWLQVATVETADVEGNIDVYENIDFISASWNTSPQDQLLEFSFSLNSIPDWFSNLSVGDSITGVGQGGTSYDFTIDAIGNPFEEFGNTIVQVTVQQSNNSDFPSDIVSFNVPGTILTPPLTTGTEGQIRYNKDEGALQLYTDSWIPAGADSWSIISSNNVTLQSNKKYIIEYAGNVSLTLADGTTVGETVQFVLKSTGPYTHTLSATLKPATNISPSYGTLYTGIWNGEYWGFMAITLDSNYL